MTQQNERLSGSLAINAEAQTKPKTQGEANQTANIWEKGKKLGNREHLLPWWEVGRGPSRAKVVIGVFVSWGWSSHLADPTAQSTCWARCCYAQSGLRSGAIWASFHPRCASPTMPVENDIDVKM